MFYENLMDICNQKGLSATPILKELGISTGNLSGWKKGGAVSSDILMKLSDRLDVSVDYLLKGKSLYSSDALTCASKNEETLLIMYRELSDYQKNKCYSYIQGMYDSIEKTAGSAG